MKKILGLLGVAFTLVVVLVANGIGNGLGRSVANNISTPSKRSVIEKAVLELNKSLPRMIDQDTRLDKTSPGQGDVIEYHYTVITAPNNNVPLSAFQELEANLRARICDITELRPAFSAGVGVDYIYKANDQSQIGRVSFSPNDCSSQTPAIIQPAAQAMRAKQPNLPTVDLRKAISRVVVGNMSGITNSPTVYFLPAENAPDFMSQYGKQANKIRDDLARGILPGSLIAYASPASERMASIVVAEFSKLEPNTLFGVRILFIALPSDDAAVANAVKPSGAEYIFIDISGIQ